MAADIAFTSWADEDQGHVWRVPADGGTPQQITLRAGEYLNTAWSPDGADIVVTRGSGATSHGRTVANNQYYEFVRVPADGGEATLITRVERPYTGGRPMMPRRPIAQASFGPDGRLFYPETTLPMGDEPTGTEIASIRLDGSDRRVHFTLPDADEAAVSPDGQWLAFQEGDNVFTMPFPYGGTGSNTVRIAKREGQLPVTQVSLEGGIHPRWRDANTLEFVSGPRYYTHNAATGDTEEIPIRLELPRNIPAGTIAFTGARIITVENDRVIESGTVVVQDGRLACVGDCDASGADQVFDAAGRTIMPGLIDMHAHHHRDHEGVIPQRNWESGIYLAYGITTTLDNSQWSSNVFAAAELTEAGAMIGPRAYSTGDPIYSGDGARQNEITSYEAADQNVARLMSWGAVSIKEYMQPRRDQRQWVTEAARERGLRVTAEGGDLEYNLGMIMDGHTGWEHPMSYTPLYSDVAKFFGQAEAVYSPTFMVGGPGAWNEEYFYQTYEIWKDPKMRRWLPWRMLVPSTRRRMLRPETDYSFPLMARGLGDIIEEGGWGRDRRPRPAPRTRFPLRGVDGGGGDGCAHRHRDRHDPRRPLPGAGTRTRVARRGQGRGLPRARLEPARRHPQHGGHRVRDQGRDRLRRRHARRAVAGGEALRRLLLGGRGRAPERRPADGLLGQEEGAGPPRSLTPMWPYAHIACAILHRRDHDATGSGRSFGRGTGPGL